MTHDDIIRMAREAGMERVVDVHKDGTRTIELPHPDLLKRFAALAQQVKPLTIERLRDALVASRIIPPAAVEDPDEYDDGVTLLRIEALHRRIT